MQTQEIKEHMEVVGADGGHIGIVDHLEGERIKLTRSDSKAHGRHHYVPLSLVDKVDDFVVLSLNASDTIAQWEVEPQ